MNLFFRRLINAPVTGNFVLMMLFTMVLTWGSGLSLLLLHKTYVWTVVASISYGGMAIAFIYAAWGMFRGLRREKRGRVPGDPW